MRALIVGMGSIGRRHAANLRVLCPDATLEVVREPDMLGAALKDKPALALLCTPSARRLEYLLPLLEHDVPCYVEKPLVATAEDARKLTEFLARRARIPLIAVGCNLRMLPSLRRLRALVAGGEIGTVVRASLEAGQWLPDWRPGRDYRASYSARRSAGGGVILDLIHEIDMARWLFGEFDRALAAAGKLSTLEIDSEDTACLVLARPKPPLVSIGLDYVSRRRVRRYEVVGEQGTLVWDLDRPSLERIDAQGARTVEAAPEAFDVSRTYVAALREFLDCIEKGGEPSCGVQDGLRSAQLALQAKRAAGLCG
jgi:predicted dehydrogenase